MISILAIFIFTLFDFIFAFLSLCLQIIGSTEKHTQKTCLKTAFNENLDQNLGDEDEDRDEEDGVDRHPYNSDDNSNRNNNNKNLDKSSNTLNANSNNNNDNNNSDENRGNKGSNNSDNNNNNDDNNRSEEEVEDREETVDNDEDVEEEETDEEVTDDGNGSERGGDDDDKRDSDKYTVSDTNNAYNNNNNNNNETKVDIIYANNYGSGFGGERAVRYDTDNNGTDFYVRALDIRRSRGRSLTTGANHLGRSVDGMRRSQTPTGGTDSLRAANDRVPDLHGNKVNIETDPQQPAYDEAIGHVMDDMGHIHIHDGPGGTYALPTDRNHIAGRYSPDQPFNYNDKDFGFIERIAADRRPIVRVTRIRKRLRPESATDYDDRAVNAGSLDDIDRKAPTNVNNDKERKPSKNQYIPVLVMDREDITGSGVGAAQEDKEEKVRRYRSGDLFDGRDSDLSLTSGVSAHFQNQKRQQQQHFRSQTSRAPKPGPPNPTTGGAIAVAASDRDKKLEFRGFVATRNGAGKMIAIPMYKNVGTVDSTTGAGNRRKRVRVVHRMVQRPPGGDVDELLADIPVLITGDDDNYNDNDNPRQALNDEIFSPSIQKSNIQNHRQLPRILVPEQSHPFLPFYGPSLTQIKKVQILAPTGPLPSTPAKPNMELLAVFRPNHRQQMTTRAKPRPKLTEYLVINRDNNDDNENSYDRLEKRVSVHQSSSRPADTGANKPAVRINVKPKQSGKRLKNKRPAAVSRHRNETSLKTSTTRQPPSVRPVDTTTAPTFIEAVVKLIDNNGQVVGAGGQQPRDRPAVASGGHSDGSSSSSRIKLSRNGKRLGPKDNFAQQITATTRSPVRQTLTPQPPPQRPAPPPPPAVRHREPLVIGNTGPQSLHNYDYYDIVDSNHTVSYVTTIDDLPTTTVAPPPPPTPPPKRKPAANRPKKGSAALPSRPAPVYSTPDLLSQASKCTQSKCKLPDCFCGGQQAPRGMRAADIPQQVMITFDDSVNDLNWEIYEEVFGGRHNPNGCPILGTFYVSHEWTDYGQVQTLYSQGHEMASHSITHSFGEKFSVQKWGKEVSGQREILHMYGGVALADVRGMRAPFLQGGGNKQFEMLYDLNFTYDSTMPVFENSPPYYPYTLDYAVNHECMIAPCPTKSFPGVWEVGMVMWHDLKGGRCSMGDACSNPTDEEGVHKMLMKNFNRHYQSNRAPFGLYYHSAWFNTPHHRKGFMRFIDDILTKKDVYFVTKYQMIQWMRHPTPTSDILGFQPWQCDFDDRPPPCKSPTVCNVGSKSGSRFLKTCQPCPSSYPWVGSTGYTPPPTA